MLKNVIFDLGNVCVTFQPDLYFYPKYQHDTKRLCQKLFHSQIWSNYDQGLIQKEDIEVQKIAALYFLDDMAIKDIAKLLGLKENTTKIKLYRLINKLKDLKMEE